MLRMVVAPFRSCRKMRGLKTSQHDYQTAPREGHVAKKIADAEGVSFLRFQN